MEIELIFYRAGATGRNGETAKAFAGALGASLSTHVVLPGETLAAALEGALARNPLVLVCSGDAACAREIFAQLHVPLDELGEPVGVLRLAAQFRSRSPGWLVESERQAVALLPDDPPLLAGLLEKAAPVAAKKFGLRYSRPKRTEADFELAAEASAAQLRR